MKKFSLIFILLWQCIIADAQTSVYHEFPDSNATWNVFWSSWGYGLQTGNYVYTFSNDTIINGLTYHKINGYAAAIREDLIQKKVYVIPLFDSVPQLLYDFNLNVGDTLKGYLGISSTSYGDTVTTIDSILINSNYRKRWTIHADARITFGNKYYIIEGIGSSKGLLQQYQDFESDSNLECFSQNNQTIYPSADSIMNCASLTSISDKRGIEKLYIFPNPTNGKFQVKLLGIIGNILEITDVLGNVIMKLGIKNDTIEIDLLSQPEGVYFVRVSNSSGNFAMKKIVKQ